MGRNCELIECTDNFINAFLRHDTRYVMGTMHSDMICMKKGKFDMSAGYLKLRHYLQSHDFDQNSVIQRKYFVAYEDTSVCLIYGIFKYYDMNRERRDIITFAWHMDEDEWKVSRICVTEKVFMEDISDSRVALEDERKNMYFVGTEDIIYIEAFNIKSIVYMNDCSVNLNKPMHEFEKRLPQNFVRIHRSYIVNMMHVTALKRYFVELCGNIVLPVPEKKYSQVKQIFVDRLIL